MNKKTGVTFTDDELDAACYTIVTVADDGSFSHKEFGQSVAEIYEQFFSGSTKEEMMAFLPKEENEESDVYIGQGADHWFVMEER